MKSTPGTAIGMFVENGKRFGLQPKKRSIVVFLEKEKEEYYV
jgi:hypothetical protein